MAAAERADVGRPRLPGRRALAMGMEASIYFTFWGLQRLQRGGRQQQAQADRDGNLKAFHSEP